MNSLQFFARYSYPCSVVLLEREEIDEKTQEKLKNIYEPDKELLEKVFWRALVPLEKLAKKMNSDIFDINVQKKYWYETHNELLSKQCKGFEHIKGKQLELCKIYPAEIINTKGVVKYLNGERKVKLDFIEKPKKGNLVTIHYNYACEKIDKKIVKLILNNLSD